MGKVKKLKAVKAKKVKPVKVKPDVKDGPTSVVTLPPILPQRHLNAFVYQPGHKGIRGPRLKANTPSLTRRLKALLMEPYPVGLGGTKVAGHKQLYADKLVETLGLLAARGEFQHLSLVFDRTEGRVPISIQNTGQQAPAITFNFAVGVPPGKKPPTIDAQVVPRITVAPELPSGENIRRMAEGQAPIPENDDAG